MRRCGEVSRRGLWDKPFGVPISNGPDQIGHPSLPPQATATTVLRTVLHATTNTVGGSLRYLSLPKGRKTKGQNCTCKTAQDARQFLFWRFFGHVPIEWLKLPLKTAQDAREFLILALFRSCADRVAQVKTDP